MSEGVNGNINPKANFECDFYIWRINCLYLVFCMLNIHVDVQNMGVISAHIAHMLNINVGVQNTVHISSVTKACYCHLRSLVKLHLVLAQSAGNTIAVPLAISRLVHCNSTLWGLAATQLKTHYRGSRMQLQESSPEPDPGSTLHLQTCHILRI